MFKGIPPVPDSAFVQKLKEFDPGLDIVFNRRFGKFVIRKKKAFGKPFGLLVVQTDNGEFRQPDIRDIKTLYDGDLWRHGGVKKRIVDGEERAARLREKESADVTDELRAVSRDSKIQLRNTFRKATNTGSKQPEFRRVILKPRGLTLDQIRAARAIGQDPWAGFGKVQ